MYFDDFKHFFNIWYMNSLEHSFALLPQYFMHLNENL